MLPYLKPLTGGLLGFLAGWYLARPASGGNTANDLADKASSHEVSPLTVDPETPKSLQFADGAVWVPPDKLASIARDSLAARMYMDDEGDWSCVNALHSWVPMTDDEKTGFKRVLQEAARKRLAWERANVTTKETGPGEWRVFFPGDGGEAKLNLQRSIEALLGPERAGQIDILGDTGGFFGMKWLAPGFRHGEIRVLATPEKTFLNQADIQLSVEIDGRAIGMMLDDQSLETKAFAKRILPRMGGPDVIRRGAKARP